MSDIAERLDYLEAVLPVPIFVDVKWIAGKLAVSTTYLDRNHYRYLCPAYGVTEVPGKSQWSLKTFREWMTVAPAERKREWELFRPAVKQAIKKKWGVR